MSRRPEVFPRKADGSVDFSKMTERQQMSFLMSGQDPDSKPEPPKPKPVAVIVKPKQITEPARRSTRRPTPPAKATTSTISKSSITKSNSKSSTAKTNHRSTTTNKNINPKIIINKNGEERKKPGPKKGWKNKLTSSTAASQPVVKKQKVEPKAYRKPGPKKGWKIKKAADEAAALKLKSSSSITSSNISSNPSSAKLVRSNSSRSDRKSQKKIQGYTPGTNKPIYLTNISTIFGGEILIGSTQKCMLLSD